MNYNGIYNKELLSGLRFYSDVRVQEYVFKVVAKSEIIQILQ